MIQPTSNHSGFYRMDAVTTSAGKNTPETNVQDPTGERLSSAQTDALRSALGASPEIRPEVVQRGRQLAIGPGYPPREIIEQISKILVQSRDPSTET